MSQIAALVETLKKELRARRITYADIAAHLNLSESSIKRQFSEGRFTLNRLEDICQLAGLEVSELFQKMQEQRNRISTLTYEQEEKIVEDPRLLLVATCVLNHWGFEEIIRTYQITEHEGIQLLAQLDRLNVIELLPLNRIRLIVANDFRWLPGGPVQKFFRETVQPDFLQSDFTSSGEALLFRNGMLSRGSNATLIKKMNRLLSGFSELHDGDTGLPLEERFGSSLMIALRPWEFSFFRKLRRNPEEKVF
jgi:transcriptional regulator with XRE-family HTH domain